jgi:acyl-coenzyme A thioesterase 13
MSDATPAGFEPSERTGPFFDLIGPIYTKASDDGVMLGLRARREHCNARGLVHGAIFAALLDVVAGRNCVIAAGADAHGFLTVNMNISYMTVAREGDWLEASAQVARVGRTLAFADSQVDVDAKTVAKASVVFALVARTGH